MSLTGTGRKAAVLCTAVVLFGTLAVPAHASVLPPAAASALIGSGADGSGGARDPLPRRHCRRQVQ